jgi:hypothetical protein
VRRLLMNKSVPCLATALAFAGAAAIVTPATAQEMQFSGPEIATQVEIHAISAADGSGQVFGVDKIIGTVSLPGLFDSMHEIVTEGVRLDGKRGHGEVWGSLFWTNNDGTMTGSYKGDLTFTMDEKGQARGLAEGTFEMTDGTGRFAHVRGHGTWNGNFEGPSIIGRMNLSATGFEKHASTQ